MDGELIIYALEILEKRAQNKNYSREERMCYDSAADILMAAIEGKEDILRQFDY